MSVDNPYQAPASADEPAVAPVAGLRRVRGLALSSIWLYGVASLAAAVDHVRLALMPASDSTEDPIVDDSEYGPLDGVMSVAGLLSIILYLVWKHRAAFNARLLDPAAMRISPAMAVGSYFIPFANFVIPYKAMAGISRATLGDAGGVVIWWACHLASLVILMALAASYLVEIPFLLPAWIEHFSIVWDFVTLFVSGWLVMRITRAQSAKCAA